MSEVKDYDNVRRVIAVMKDTFGSTFSTYYDGDPQAIPTFNLPALIVTLNSDETVEESQGEDNITENITVKVVLDKRDDFSHDAVDPLNMTERKIREFVGKRDAAGNIERQTVKAAIRSLKFDGLVEIAHSMSIEYGINPRIAGGGLADLTAEGHVTFDIEYDVVSS